MLYNSNMAILNKDVVQQTLRGYAEVNEIAFAERAEALAQMTHRDSWAIFDALYDAWKRTGQQAGGDWEVLAAQRLADTFALREAFEQFAKRKGLL